MNWAVKLMQTVVNEIIVRSKIRKLCLMEFILWIISAKFVIKMQVINMEIAMIHRLQEEIQIFHAEDINIIMPFVSACIVL